MRAIFLLIAAILGFFHGLFTNNIGEVKMSVGIFVAYLIIFIVLSITRSGVSRQAEGLPPIGPILDKRELRAIRVAKAIAKKEALDHEKNRQDIL